MAEPELEARTMHVFISRALQKVLREAPKKHAQLRQACTEVIDELKKHGAESFPPPADLDGSPPQTPQPRDGASGEHAANSGSGRCAEPPRVPSFTPGSGRACFVCCLCVCVRALRAWRSKSLTPLSPS